MDKISVKQIFIDPDEQLYVTVAVAFPNANIMVSEECVMRYVREGFQDVIKKKEPDVLFNRDIIHCVRMKWSIRIEHAKSLVYVEAFI